jgi:hypothetical protein
MGLRERAQRLAGALQLDEAERAHLLDLAHAAHPTSLGRFTRSDGAYPGESSSFRNGIRLGYGTTRSAWPGLARFVRRKRFDYRSPRVAGQGSMLTGRPRKATSRSMAGAWSATI